MAHIDDARRAGPSPGPALAPIATLLLVLSVVPLVFAQGATVEVTPAGTGPAGSSVTVRWSGPNGPGDYITVVRHGAAPAEYLNYRPTSDGRAPVNPVSLVLPAEPGAYEIRYMRGNPRSVLVSVPYEVTAVVASIDGPASVTPGSRFDVAWAGPNNGGDWVTIVAAGAPPRAYGSYVDARSGRPDKTGRVTATLRAPDRTGLYELRYVQQGTRVIGTRAIEIAAASSGGQTLRDARAEGAAPTAGAPAAAARGTAGNPTAGQSQPAAEAVFAPSAPQNQIAAPRGDGNVMVGPVTADAAPQGQSRAMSGGLTPVNGVIQSWQDPGYVTARQIGEGQVQLAWPPVPGAAAYFIIGPGVEQGVRFTGTSATISGLPAGSYRWLVSTWYEPDGPRTPATGWPGANLTVTTSRGYYRVTATQVVVHRDEADNPGIGDGRGIEIFATSYAQVFDRRDGRQSAAPPLSRSPVHGDVTGNPSGGVRVLAGSLTSNGGIRSGDEVRLMEPAAGTAGYRPFVLWEGELQSGIDALLIRPVVWEFDGQSGPWFAPYLQRLSNERAGQLFEMPAVRAALSQTGISIGTALELNQRGPWTADTEDHPLGVTFPLVTGAGLSAGTASELAWFDRWMLLTREKLEPLLEQGGGEAGLELRWTGEGRERIADVTLVVKVERAAPPAGALNVPLIEDALRKLRDAQVLPGR